MRASIPFALSAALGASISCADSSSVDRTRQAASTATTTIPTTGQSFEIAITSPGDHDTLPLGPFTVTGSVAIGGVAGTPVNVISVADLSGSTTSIVGDCNGDGVRDRDDDFNLDNRMGDVLDCEISGINALNQSLFGTQLVDVGIVGFGQSAAIADMQTAAGLQSFTAPPEVDGNGNLVPDHEEVARSLISSRIRSFTLQNVGSLTNFDGALAAVNSAFAGEPAGERGIAFFMSDGNPYCPVATCGAEAYTGLAGPLDDAVIAGTTINTFAVGRNVTGCVAGSALQEIADATGGSCTEVDDPTTLATALPGLTPSGLDRVEVNGTVVPVDAVGNFSLDLTRNAGDVIEIQAIGYANDPDATTVLADITVNCCEDADGDGTCDADDDCPFDADNDADADGVCGDVDNCPDDDNSDQADFDGDGVGDACDVCPFDADNDIDGDGVCADLDNCPVDDNSDQADGDGDGDGDVCDLCPADPDNDLDGDGVCGDVDNCPADANSDQADADADADGDVCDACPDDAGNDADGDGLCADVDACPDTAIPESVPTQRLGTNRWALVDGDTVFDTTSPNGHGPGRSYTVEDTAGCSCEQIIVALDRGKGHVKFGCSIGTMDEWVALQQQ